MSSYADETRTPRSLTERRPSFHSVRCAACTNLYRRTKDIRLTQRFARHKSILTTSICAHPSDEDLVRAVRERYGRSGVGR